MAIGSQESGAISGAASGASAGMAFGPWGAVIGGAIGGIAGFLSGGDEDEARKLAEKQARLIEMTDKENRRRQMLAMGQTLGYTTAAVGASNLQMSGSAKRYRNAQETQFRADMAWQSNKARLEAEMARDGGQVAANTIQSAGISGMVGSIGSAASSGAFGSYTKAGGYKGPFS